LQEMQKLILEIIFEKLHIIITYFQHIFIKP